MKQDEIASNAASRRNFLKGAGMTGLGLAGAAIIGSGLGAGVPKANAAVVTDASYSDADIINFALNLEYLEAEFYSVATYGATLVQRGVLTKADETGPTTGGKMVDFSPLAFLATALREDEKDHVLFLRETLGSGAVKKPAINLNALGFGFAGVATFLGLARIFEDVGVSAYLGAAPLISNKTYLGAAAAILATEAQHSGAIRMYCIMKGIKSPKVDSKDIPPSPSTVFDVDSNALSIPRTTAEVLKIVYGGGNCSGGFYPDGMNGTITCAS